MSQSQPQPQANSTSPPLSTHSISSTPPTHPSSPMMSLLRFLQSPHHTSASPYSSSNSNSSGSQTNSPYSSNTQPISYSPASSTTSSTMSPSGLFRTHSEPVQSSTSLPHPRFIRAHSLSEDENNEGGMNEPFKLEPSAKGINSTDISPTLPAYRTFTLKSGYPSESSKHSNGFLELLSKQDSFFSND